MVVVLLILSCVCVCFFFNDLMDIFCFHTMKLSCSQVAACGTLVTGLLFGCGRNMQEIASVQAQYLIVQYCSYILLVVDFPVKQD